MVRRYMTSVQVMRLGGFVEKDDELRHCHNVDSCQEYHKRQNYQGHWGEQRGERYFIDVLAL